MTILRHACTLLAILASLSMLTGATCGPPLNQDPGFDLWCGETLCAWNVDRGTTERAPTWHRSDHGVSLVGPDVVISQRVEMESVADCLRFEMLVDRDEDVQLFVEMDFQDDGSTEYSHPISTTDWRPARYLITPPSWYTSVRFIIRKTGAGRAVLAQIEVTDDEGCTEPPMDMDGRPRGAACEKATQCDTGECAEVMVMAGCFDECYFFEGGVCGDCTDDADCDAQMACGRVLDADWTVFRGCVPAGEKVLGEWCATDDDCSTGICCESLCSACCEDVPCPAGTCRRRTIDVVDPAQGFPLFPWQCDPQQGRGQTGAVCLADSDCASGVCQAEAELGICLVLGNRCREDADCMNGTEGTCMPLGADGGSCL